MTLDEYLNKFSTREEVEAWKKAAEHFVAENQEHIKENFESECRLPQATWEQVFIVLKRASEDQLQAKLAVAFREHVLKGPEVANAPQPKGRALERARFTELALEANLLTSPEAAVQFVDDVRAGITPVVPYNQQLRACQLGRHSMWSTFGEEGNDPFSGFLRAETVRAQLGLQEPNSPEDQELVLLAYNVPPEIAERYPTIADAYAADEWPSLFQCSNSGDPWGYTAGGRPEIVHEVIAGACLIASGEGEPAFNALRIVN